MVAALLALLMATACGGGPAGPSAFDEAPIGFILVGARDDLGYNQAVWEGADALARRFPDHPVLRSEGVSEDPAEARAALEALIDRGARILFATSFGHLAAAYEVAKDHPEVYVLHQGGIEPTPRLPNLGTFFGAHYEPEYLAGIAAGAATETGRLGYVVAFPIPATFLNVNAFTLGARGVRPGVTVEVAFTQDWCDPAAQRAAAEQLLARDVDVLAQHQDCTRTILEIAERAQVKTVGYHADGSEVAPTAWLTGAVWQWGELYSDIVTAILAGEFTGGPYDGDFRSSLGAQNSVLALASLAPSVSNATRRQIAEAERAFAGGATPFDGPIVDRAGTVRVHAGERLPARDLDRVDWFVEGVRGAVPAS